MGDVDMPNAVYERTRSALTGLLPRRAATNVLDRALQLHQRSADEIDGEQMARVLLSGVYRELHGLLPDPGLRRTLRRLARDARGWSKVARGATPSEVRRAAPAPTAGADATDVHVADVPEPVDDPGIGAPVETAPVETTLVETAPVETAPVEAPPIGPAPLATAPGPTLGRAMAPLRRRATVEGVSAALAALDGVNGVGLFDAAGRPVDIRGALADAPLLGRMVVAGAALLETAHPLRSVAVDTARGRLVAVPVRPQWLALTGTAELNLGAVYAALAALEEER